MWCQDKLCLEHASLHWETCWRNSWKEVGEASGPGNDYRSPGAQHNMWQFLHLICSWSGAAKKNDHGGDGQKEQAGVASCLTHYQGQGSFSLWIYLHHYTHSCVLLPEEKEECAPDDSAQGGQETWITTGTKGESLFIFPVSCTFFFLLPDCFISTIKMLLLSEMHIEFVNNTESFLFIWICKYVLDVIN